MTDSSVSPVPRRSRGALLRKWLGIALVLAFVLVPLLVWLSASGAARP